MWLLLIPAVFFAVLVVIHVLEDKPKRNNVREMGHVCWPDCSSSQRDAAARSRPLHAHAASHFLAPLSC